MSTDEDREQRLRRRFGAIGQAHVFAFWDEIGPSEREALLADLESIPFDELNAAIQSLRGGGGSVEDAELDQIVPVRPWSREPDEGRRALYECAHARGLAELARGTAAALTVAGGQGSRLGFEGPKGGFPIGPLSGSCLFEIYAESIARASDRHGCSIPWYVMTSDATHAATVALFEANEYYGLEPSFVRVFRQGRMPSFTVDGAILLASRSRLALAPDGHGGMIEAMARSGVLEQMQRDGTDHLSIFQVDNPLVRCIDPQFIGLHAQTGSEVSCKVIPKAEDREGLGNLCSHKGRLRCLEYSDFPDELATARNADGTRRYDAGGISIYVFSVNFLSRLVGGGVKLPWHAARKKVPYLDAGTGKQVVPSEPNATKLERFLFDVLPLAETTLVWETVRSEEFSPVKNGVGRDSIDTCRRDMVRRACAWLAKAGVEVPRKPDGEPDATVEISPRFADSADDLRNRVHPGMKVQPGAQLYLR